MTRANRRPARSDKRIRIQLQGVRILSVEHIRGKLAKGGTLSIKIGTGKVRHVYIYHVRSTDHGPIYNARYCKESK